MPFTTRDEAIESLKKVTVVDSFFKLKRDAAGNEVIGEDCVKTGERPSLEKTW